MTIRSVPIRPRYDGDELLDYLFSEHEQRTLSKATGAAGGFLLPSDFSDAIVSAKRARSVIGELARQFETDNGRALRIPSATAHGAGAWTVEPVRHEPTRFNAIRPVREPSLESRVRRGPFPSPRCSSEEETGVRAGISAKSTRLLPPWCPRPVGSVIAPGRPQVSRERGTPRRGCGVPPDHAAARGCQAARRLRGHPLSRHVCTARELGLLAACDPEIRAPYLAARDRFIEQAGGGATGRRLALAVDGLVLDALIRGRIDPEDMLEELAALARVAMASRPDKVS